MTSGTGTDGTVHDPFTNWGVTTSTFAPHAAGRMLLQRWCTDVDGLLHDSLLHVSWELRATSTSATNMGESDCGAKRSAEPETGMQISELSVEPEYVKVVFDVWHNIFFSTCSKRRSMSDANDAQYDWPCNALPCSKLATLGLDAKNTKRLSQNDHGLSCGRADFITHIFKSYPMCSGAFGLCNTLSTLGWSHQQSRLSPQGLL